MIRAVDTTIERGAVGNGEALESRASRGVTAYSYGWPSGGTSEPNVAAQWLFDESAGDIVDEVSGVTAVPFGTNTYNQAASGSWAGLSPGILVSGGASNGFEKAAGDASLNIGIGDFTIEYVFSSTYNTNTQNVFDWRDNGPNYRGIAILHTHSANQIGLTIKDELDNVNNGSWTVVGIDLDSGDVRKVRITGERGSNAELFVNIGAGDVSQGVVAITGAPGAFNCNKLVIGNRTDKPNNAVFGGTLYEYRVSHNSTNNSGP